MYHNLKHIYDILRNKKSLEKIYYSYSSMKEVAKKLGCGETLIHTWIHRLGIKPKPRIVTQRGHKKSIEHRRKISEIAKQRTGSKNANWRNGATKYNMLIRGKQWRERRRLVLARDNYECVKCGSDIDLHIHHIKPVNEFPELVNDLDNLKTLCAKCHRKLHFPKENPANSVKTRTVNAELNGDDPTFFNITGTLPKCVETIYGTVSNN